MLVYELRAVSSLHCTGPGKAEREREMEKRREEKGDDSNPEAG